MKNSMITVVLMLSTFFNVNAQKHKSSTRVERVLIAYQGKTVKAKKLSVSSEIPMPIDQVWANVKTSDLLVFVTEEPF